MSSREVARFTKFPAMNQRLFLQVSYVVPNCVCSMLPSMLHHPTQVHVYIAGLMGLMEKRRFRNFLIYVNDYDEKDPKTHKGMSSCNVCKFADHKVQLYVIPLGYSVRTYFVSTNG